MFVLRVKALSRQTTTRTRPRHKTRPVQLWKVCVCATSKVFIFWGGGAEPQTAMTAAHVLVRAHTITLATTLLNQNISHEERNSASFMPSSRHIRCGASGRTTVGRRGGRPTLKEPNGPRYRADPRWRMRYT